MILCSRVKLITP